MWGVLVSRLRWGGALAWSGSRSVWDGVPERVIAP